MVVVARAAKVVAVVGKVEGGKVEEEKVAAEVVAVMAVVLEVLLLGEAARSSPILSGGSMG